MTTRTQQTTPGRWALFFLAAIAAGLAAILGLTTTSATATAGAETRVGAFNVAGEVLVGPSEHVIAGQRLGNNAAGPEIVVATSVAAKTGGGLADEAAVLRGNADDVVVLGRQADTAVANGWDGHVVLNTPNWSLELNDAFIRSAIDQGRRIYLAAARQETVPQVTLSS